MIVIHLHRFDLTEYLLKCTGSSTPVAQEGKFPPSSESNVRKAYLSRQFEDHTKNFILRAQERFELQAEKRKQQAKTKKAYSSINQLPVSSSDSNGRSVSQSIQWMSRLPIPFWFVASPQINQFDDNESGLTRLKRQTDASTAPSSSSSSSSTMNLDSVLAFVKEQTAKLEQVNRQLKSLTGSVSQGLDKLRSSGLGSLGSGSSSSGSGLANAFGLASSSSGSSSGDSASTGMGSIMQSLQAQAAQASQGITKAMGSFNPSSTSTSTGSTDSGASPSVESLQQTASNTLSQIQNAFASVANRMPSSNSGSTGGSSSSAGDVLTSIFQG